ncbi:MAG: glutathione binding-like protein [Alphaproteobacteria bacterium]|nr:glutathione binding-like protein [Alphaproteobacteria bacterium]
MDYAYVNDAKDQLGLRLALTMGVPGPWSQAAKYLFQYKNYPFIAVGQKGAQENPELFAWTGHRNAPVAVYEDEMPRVGWYEIVMLAERLAPEPRLVPASSAARAEMFGLMTEMASEGGLAWQRRLAMIDVMRAAITDPKARQLPDTLADRYGYSSDAAARANEVCTDILAMLAGKLGAQAARGSDYFVGDEFTAADLYWACFSQLVAPMAEDLNPMPERLRGPYTAPDSVKIEPILLRHRDTMYQRHLSLPLDF